MVIAKLYIGYRQAVELSLRHPGARTVDYGAQPARLVFFISMCASWNFVGPSP
jgi:hypothetical protein